MEYYDVAALFIVGMFYDFFDGVALLYEWPSGNQVDGLPLVVNNTRAVVSDVPHPPATFNNIWKNL